MLAKKFALELGCKEKTGEPAHRRATPRRAPYGRTAPVEQTEIRFETPDPGSALPVVAGLRADRDARPRNARRDRDHRRASRSRSPPAAARRREAEMPAPRLAPRYSPAQLNAGGGASAAMAATGAIAQQDAATRIPRRISGKRAGRRIAFMIDCLAQKAPGNHRPRAAKTALARQYRGCV